jgi:acetyl-CoA acyltransferase
MARLYGTDSMPETAENVARDHAISREDQDAFALRSQERAAKAISNGRLAREIVAISVPQPKGEPTVVDRGVRRAVATMCIAVGQGISLLLEAP